MRVTAGRRRDRKCIVVDGGTDMHCRCCGARRREQAVGHCGDALESITIAAVGTVIGGQHRALRFQARIAHIYQHQKAVELRLRQRIGAFEFKRVLGGDDHEIGCQWIDLAIDSDGAFFHRLQHC